MVVHDDGNHSPVNTEDDHDRPERCHCEAADCRCEVERSFDDIGKCAAYEIRNRTYNKNDQREQNGHDEDRYEDGTNDLRKNPVEEFFNL